MAHYCAAYRGLHPISDKSNYEIKRTAFDFQRFLPPSIYLRLLGYKPIILLWKPHG